MSTTDILIYLAVMPALFGTAALLLVWAGLKDVAVKVALVGLVTLTLPLFDASDGVTTFIASMCGSMASGLIGAVLTMKFLGWWWRRGDAQLHADLAAMLEAHAAHDAEVADCLKRSTRRYESGDETFKGANFNEPY